MSFWIVLLMGTYVLGQVQVFESPTLTSFTCHGRPPGYYADIETGCKAYHVCDGNSHFTYVCPKRTLFQQRTRICDHSYLVTCEDSPQHAETETETETEPEYPDHDIFIPFTDSEHSYLTTDFSEEDYNQTESYIPTELTTELTAEELTEMTTTKPETTREKLTNKNEASQSIEKFIKFRLKDFRSLFYIPEFDNNSILAVPERELLLPVDKNKVMRFRYRKWNSSLYSQCPSHCNPRFFLPGFCHPCIMIK